MVDVLGLAADGASVDVPAQRGRAAALNGPHRAEMLRWNLAGELGAIGWAVGAKDVGQFGHGLQPVAGQQRLHDAIDSIGGQRVRFARQVGIERGGLG
jgi:hypothetical protein